MAKEPWHVDVFPLHLTIPSKRQRKEMNRHLAANTEPHKEFGPLPGRETDFGGDGLNDKALPSGHSKLLVCVWIAPPKSTRV